MLHPSRLAKGSGFHKRWTLGPFGIQIEFWSHRSLFLTFWVGNVEIQVNKWPKSVPTPTISG